MVNIIAKLVVTMVLGMTMPDGMSPRVSDTYIDFRYGNVRSALDQAQAEGKMVFVDVYASWCTACKLMDESTFTSGEVVSLINEHFIPVKIDVESLEGKLFAVQENVQTLPAIIVLDDSGKRLAKVNKALEVDAMIQMLKRQISSHR